MTLTKAPVPTGTRSASRDVDAFLSQARSVAPVAERAGRLVFTLDATMSRQPTWDMASGVQSAMFDAAASIGGLSVQLVYFRGFSECRASGWVGDPRRLAALMARIDCRSGSTQIGRVLSHVETEARDRPVAALVYVGDAMEESLDVLCGKAGELGLRGTKAFMFHEGGDPTAVGAFAEIARLTGGASLAFDSRSPASLEALLRAVAAYAAGGSAALARLGERNREARRLISALPSGSRPRP